MLNYEYPPLGGGAGNATLYLLKEFCRQNDFFIDLVTSSPDQSYVKSLSDKVRIHGLNINKHNHNLQHQSYRDLLTYSWRANKYIRTLHHGNNFDFVHSFFAVPCGIVAERLNKPQIISLRGTDVPGHNPKFRLAYSILHPFIKRVFRNANIIAANSDDLKNEALNFEQRQYEIIPNGVDLDFYSPFLERPSDFRILYVGRLHAVKNIPILIEAFAKFVSAGVPNAKLTLTGDGPELLALKRQVQKLGLEQAVNFTGHLSKDRLRDEYRNCSVFTLLSAGEGMSNTLLEAMACGTPILTTRTGGAAQLVDASNGWIVSEANTATVSEAIKLIYQSRAVLQSMGQASRAKAETLSWANTAKQYANLYHRMYELA
ncbi:MAG: glycosyltransferase family 4 protein [Patescibacteria group bacterium]|jgi:glycosyltransferase involved in cell wall biosynthesis